MMTLRVYENILNITEINTYIILKIISSIKKLLLIHNNTEDFVLAVDIHLCKEALN